MLAALKSAQAPKSALESALALAQAADARAPAAWLLTAGAQLVASVSRPAQPAHAGVWGLARAARTEAQLHLGCLDGFTSACGLRRAIAFDSGRLAAAR